MPFLILTLVSITPQTTAENIDQLSNFVKIKKIIQDDNGYIWFAGHNGLARFDGENVITFSSYNEKWNIPFTWIVDVIKEKNDFIITTESHQVWRFNPKTGQTSQLNINIPDNNLTITGIFKNDYFFKNIKNQIYRYSTINNLTTVIAEKLDISHITPTKENLYFGGRNGLYRFDNNTFINLSPNEVLCIADLREGIVIVTEKSIVYRGDDGSRYEIPNGYHSVRSTISNDNNVLLLNKSGKITKLSIPELTEIDHNYPKIESLVPNEMIQDASNTLWISSNKGIKKVSPSSIKNHPKIYNVVNNANEIELFNNKIIIGTYGDGIHTIESDLKRLSSTINNALTPLAKKTMDMLAIDNDLYIATFDGLWIYNSVKKSIEKNDILKDKLILKLTRNKNLLYMATNFNGLYIYDLTKKTIVDHIDVKEGLSSSEIIDVMTLDNHNIWLATDNGVNKYNIYTKENLHINLPSKNKVISIATYNNKIYAATKGDGIFVLNFHGDILTRIAKGVDFSMISNINNEIWAPAHRGLYRINTTDDSITLVPNTDEFSFTDRPILHKSHVYIPHYKGMLEVPITKITQYNPNISISEIIISGQSQLMTESIVVNSENEVISLSLSSLDFRNGKNKQFKYRINGGNWHEIFGSQLTLTGLSSGTYNLFIQGTNSLGQWSDKKAFIEVNVTYPWYLTVQMKIFYVVAISITLMLITWLLFLRFRSIRHIHAILSNDIKSHSKITFNIERNLQTVRELLDQEKKHLQVDGLHQVSLLVDECIESLSTDENDNEPKSIQGKSLEVALPYFINYVHQKYHSNIKLEIDIPESRLSQEMQADIYKIIYETIISTIINGSGRNFEITIQEFKQKVWLTITNDENGFSKFKNKISFDISMYYIRQIASKYNASLNVFDKDSTGSQLIISIPLMNIS